VLASPPTGEFFFLCPLTNADFPLTSFVFSASVWSRGWPVFGVGRFFFCFLVFRLFSWLTPFFPPGRVCFAMATQKPWIFCGFSPFTLSPRRGGPTYFLFFYPPLPIFFDIQIPFLCQAPPKPPCLLIFSGHFLLFARDTS